MIISDLLVVNHTAFTATFTTGHLRPCVSWFPQFYHLQGKRSFALFAITLSTMARAFFRLASEHDLQGIVAKRKSDPYLLLLRELPVNPGVRVTFREGV